MNSTAVGVSGDSKLSSKLENIEEPFEMIKLSLNQKIYIKLRNDRELVGTLHAYDHHLNMILANVEETLTSVELDEETYEQVYKQTSRSIPLVFIRGDGVILVSAQ